MKRLADTHKMDESSLLGPVQRHVMDKNERDNSRRQDIIHPSEMAHGDWCPAATYRRIRDLRAGGTYTKESFGFQSLNIFEYGHHAHRKWQGWLWEMDWLWGTWRCLHCENIWEATAPKRCPVCSSGWLEYREVPLDCENSLLICGDADGAVPHLGTLVEIKTLGKGTYRFEDPDALKTHTHATASAGKDLVDTDALWRSLTRPLPAHLRQGQIYLHLAQQLGLAYDKVNFIYEFKENQAVKVFTVQRRERTIAPLLESAAQIRQALEDQAPPPACPHDGCKKCTTPNPQEKEESNGAASPARASERTAGADQPSPARRRRTRPEPRSAAA